jgi:hypothetical protein
VRPSAGLASPAGQKTGLSVFRSKIPLFFNILLMEHVGTEFAWMVTGKSPEAETMNPGTA